MSSNAFELDVNGLITSRIDNLFEKVVNDMRQKFFALKSMQI